MAVRINIKHLIKKKKKLSLLTPCSILYMNTEYGNKGHAIGSLSATFESQLSPLTLLGSASGDGLTVFALSETV